MLMVYIVTGPILLVLWIVLSIIESTRDVNRDCKFDRLLLCVRMFLPPSATSFTQRDL